MNRSSSGDSSLFSGVSTKENNILLNKIRNVIRTKYSKFKNKFDQIIFIFFINYIFLIIYKYAKFYIFN